jgi:hypothetical protein
MPGKCARRVLQAPDEKRYNQLSKCVVSTVLQPGSRAFHDEFRERRQLQRATVGLFFMSLVY